MKRVVLLLTLFLAACGSVLIDPSANTALVNYSPLQVSILPAPTVTPVPASYWRQRGEISGCMFGGFAKCPAQLAPVTTFPDWQEYWLGWWTGCISLDWPPERLGDKTENQICGYNMQLMMQAGIK